MKMEVEKPTTHEKLEQTVDESHEVDLMPTISFESANDGAIEFNGQIQGVQTVTGNIEISKDGERGWIMWFTLANPKMEGRGLGKKSHQALVEAMLEKWPTLRSIGGTAINSKILKIIIDTKLPDDWDKSFFTGSALFQANEQIEPQEGFERLERARVSVTFLFEKV